LATLALKITVPTDITTGNTTITCIPEDTDPSSALTLFLVRNTTRDTLAQGVSAQLGTVEVDVTIPADATGDGWTILAVTESDNVQTVGQSLPFLITDPTSKADGTRSNAGPVIGGVVAGVLAISLLVGAFIYMRRRRGFAAGPEFNIEAGFPRPTHQGSFETTSTAFAEPADKSIEMEKIQWEMQLEEQFARARAATPDISRGGSPMPRGASPVPPVPLVPQRAAKRF